MDYREFLKTVSEHAGVPSDEAQRAVGAVLTTLAERITGGEARDIAAQLPAEVRPYLQSPEPAEAFDREEFLRRVAERAGAPLPAATRYERGVFVALGRAVSRDELEDMIAQLPRDFGDLIEAAD